MNLFKKTVEKIGKGIVDLVKDPSVKKGERFEDYVLKNLFPSSEYERLQKTHSFETDSHEYVKSDKNPDFQLKAKSTGNTFWIEAKYRSSYTEGAVEWCKEYQLVRYREINKTTPVFVVLGVGGTASDPSEVFIFPIKTAKYPKIYKSVLKQFSFPAKHQVNPHQLWRLL